MANVETEVLELSRTNPDIGELTVLDTRFTKLSEVPEITRKHELVGVEINTAQHRMWVSEPAIDDDTNLTVLTKPGLGELIEDGVGWRLHETLAKQLPGARVISHATYGIGNTATRLSLLDLRNHGIEQMANQGMDLIEKFCPDERIIYVGTSLGTIIGNRLLRINTERGHPANITGVFYYAPAIVDPKNVLKDMGRFLPALAYDLVSELAIKTHPKHKLGQLITLVASRPSRHDVMPMVRQGIDVIFGTPEDEVVEVLGNYLVHVVLGTKDPVGQLNMWNRFETEFDNLSVTRLEGRGHGIAVDTVRGGKKIAKIIRNTWLDEAEL